MEDSRRQIIMGPPAAVTSTGNPSNSNTTNNAPTPQVTKTAAPPKRIIKKIQLDFNKLKEAGLDRQLAEVLRKQKLEARKVEAPTTSKPSPSAAAQSTSAAAESKLQPPQQQLRQPAPQPLVKRIMISEYIEKTVPIQPLPNPTEADRSKQVKALLKNRILNKNMTTTVQPQPKPTTSKAASSAQSSAPRSAGIPANPAAFSVPIAKADLTVRPKQPPLLLNLVNQLPKHRAMCKSSSKPLMNQSTTSEPRSAHFSVQTVIQSPQRIPVQQQAQISPQFPQHHVFQPPPQIPVAPVTQAVPSLPTRLHKSPSPPLIVLENKVLAPNEKIDLSGLRLPNPPVSATLIQVKPVEAPVQSNLPTKVIKGKVIMNANKFKVSREKLAEMAKEIRSQAEQVKVPPSPKPVKDFAPTIETPFTINSILQRKHTPLFAPPTLEGSSVPVHNPILSTESNIYSNVLPVGNLPLEPKESTEPKELPEEETTNFPVSLPTPEPKEYYEELTNKTSPLKHREYVSLTPETEGVNTIANPLDFPVYIPSTPERKESATVAKSSPLKLATTEPKEHAEKTAPVYIPLTPQGSELIDEVTTQSKVVVLPEPENLPEEPSFLDLPVCIPSTYETKEFPEGESSEPSHPDLPPCVSSTSKPDEFSERLNKESSSSEVTTSPKQAAPVQKIQSAVDFIAQLTAENHLDESSFMELSPEEQRLNALFGGGGCSFTGVSPVKKSPLPEDDLPIGKIVKMDDMSILHATLDVNSDSTNVLRISPNAMRMQSSVATMDMSLVDVEDVVDSVVEETNVQVNLENPHDEVVNVTTEVQEANAEIVNPDLSTTLGAEAEKSVEPLEESKPLSDPEPLIETKPVKKPPIRSKKAKINLVQRTKRPSIPKPVEAKKTKLEFEEEDERAMATDHSLLEDRYGVAAIEVIVNSDSLSSDKVNLNLSSVKYNPKVPAEENQREEEVIQSREEEKINSVQEHSAKTLIEEERVEKSVINLQEEHEIPTKPSTERDLTQLYHPPKMPKSKTNTKSSNQDNPEDSQPATSKSNVSLIEILSQDPPLPQGEAQLPFRKESLELNTTANISSEVTGIQNLIGHLTAEKVMPQIKKLSPMPKTEEPSKQIPRKKLVKTRPVLSKRSSKVGQKNLPEKPNHFEFLHPVSANVGGRIPTSSTSDDDGSIFLGFDNKEEKRSKTPVRSKRVKQMKLNETDISDDATPDYDETEEEQQSTEVDPPVKSAEVDTQYTFKKHTVVEAFSDDSCSSNGGPTSPMDFGDNVSIDDNRTSEDYPIRKETTWEELVNDKSTEGGNDVQVSVSQEQPDYPSETPIESVNPTVDGPNIDEPPKSDIETNTPENSLADASNENKEPKTVTEPLINENDLSVIDSKLRRSRRRSTKSITIAIDPPSKPTTSKDSLTNIRATEKRQTRSRSKTPASSENAELKLIQEVISESDNVNVPITSTEALKPLEITDSKKSRGKRKSRCSTKKPVETEAIEATELISEESKATEERLEDSVAPEVTLPSTTSENIDFKENETEEKNIERPATSGKSRGKRKTPKTKVTSTESVANSELTEESKDSKRKEEEIKATEKTLPDIKSSEKDLPVTTTERTNLMDNLEDSKREEEEIKATEKTLPDIKSSEKDLPVTTTEKTNSMDNLEHQNSLQEPETSLKSKGKRKSRSRTPKTKDPPVTQPEAVENPELDSEDTSSRKAENDKRQTRSKTPKLIGSTVIEPPITESEPLKVSEEPKEAESSLRSRGKRQSRYNKVKFSEPEKVKDTDVAVGEDLGNTSAAVIEPEEPSENVNPAENRKSRSKSPKILVPTVVQTPDVADSEETSLNTESQEKLNDFTASEEPKQAKPNKKRQSRSRTPKVLVPPVTQDEPVSTTDLSPEESLEEIKQDQTTLVSPTVTKKSRGKRCTSKSNSLAASETQPAMISIPLEEPQPSESTDSLVARAKRKTPSRYGTVPPTETPIPLVQEAEESAPKKGRRSIAAAAPAEASTPKSRKCRPTNFEEMISPIPAEPKVPSKRGRKRAAPSDLESESAKKSKTEGDSETICVVDFNLRLLLIRKREQLETDENLMEDGKGDGPLQCGLCLARCDKDNWRRHLGEHYGVGWPVGEAPKKITRAGVMTMMKNYLQNGTEKLTCRLCSHQLGSYLGMMLHLEGCGNKQRILCEFCQRSYTKLSLPVHIRTCPKRFGPSQNDEDAEPAEASVNETVYSNAGRAKRKSTIKAETKLKKIGEALISQKPGDETSAKNDFDGDSSDYDMTKDKESSEEYESEGVDSNEESSLSSEEEGSLGETFSTTKQKKSNRRGDIDRKRKLKRSSILGECLQKPLLSRYHHLEARATHKWNEFVHRNYETGPLFNQLLPSYSKISSQEANDLLPSKETASMRYAYGEISNEDDWKQLAPFEGFNKEGEYVGYLGHSIKQLAWVPLPPKVTNQYLLCSLRPKLKAFARHTKLKDEDALLMLLKCTVSSGKHEKKSWAMQPELQYGIRVPHGPVHSFCFLPSGGYDKSSNRLGLLAVANSLSDVCIYALPLELPEDQKTDENVVIQLDSLITLSLDVNNPVQDQCTKVVWSQSLGHTFLATGYSSGYIAFWDIGDNDNINCFNRNNQVYYVPLNFFYIGERNIQFMELHYDNNGPRWLAVGTSIRQFKIYDIANLSKPYILTQDPICTLYIANLTWSPICETLVVSSSHFNRTIAVSVSGIQFEHRTLDGTLTTTRDMHTNCQQNHMVFVTDNGDLVFLDVRDLNCGPALLKSMVNLRAVSTTELHQLGGTTPKDMDSIGADEFLRDYGVQIKPLVPAPHKRKSAYLDAKRLPQNSHFLPLTRSNCVRCNWNSPAHTWVAVGAEHGLLRILSFDRDKFF
nr:LOW QUALITY PROTEIN: titin [Drosophila takahashii]